MGYCMSMTGCDFRVKAENVSQVENLLEDFCFSPETDAEGNITDLDFTGKAVGSRRDVQADRALR